MGVGRRRRKRRCSSRTQRVWGLDRTATRRIDSHIDKLERQLKTQEIQMRRRHTRYTSIHRKLGAAIECIKSLMMLFGFDSEVNTLSRMLGDIVDYSDEENAEDFIALLTTGLDMVEHCVTSVVEKLPQKVRDEVALANDRYADRVGRVPARRYRRRSSALRVYNGNLQASSLIADAPQNGREEETRRLPGRGSEASPKMRRRGSIYDPKLVDSAVEKAVHFTTAIASAVGGAKESDPQKLSSVHDGYARRGFNDVISRPQRNVRIETRQSVYQRNVSGSGQNDVGATSKEDKSLMWSEVFAQIDKDGSGQITRAEFAGG